MERTAGFSDIPQRNIKEEENLEANPNCLICIRQLEFLCSRTDLAMLQFIYGNVTEQ